jgi:uncharacterized protein YidB (DUF937 family)
MGGPGPGESGQEGARWAPHPNLAGALSGLAGIADLFRKAGLGDLVDSWIGSRDNQPVSPDQIKQALGASGQLAQRSQAAGMTKRGAANHRPELLAFYRQPPYPIRRRAAGWRRRGGLLKQREG